MLEYEVKPSLWNFTMNKASGADRNPLELFHSLKNDCLKVLHSICKEFRKLNNGHRTGKVQLSFHPLRKEKKSEKLKWRCSVMSDSMTPWTVAYQASPSMGISRQEYWSGLQFPSPGDLSDAGIKPRSSILEADALTSETPGKPFP